MEIDVFGVLFDNMTLEETIERGTVMAKDGFHYVVTPNPELVNLARQDCEYCNILNNADLTLPDGIGVVYAAKLLGCPVRERIPGIDFASGLLSRMAQDGDRLFLLGARPGVAERAAENLKKQFPDLTVCGAHDGYFTDDEAVIGTIRAAKADVVFVCMGAPKQEKWIAANGVATGAHLMVGLGGCLDVFAGNVKRAPKAWQKLGLEWLYRLFQEPKRIGRMAKLPLFLVSAVGARRKGAE